MAIPATEKLQIKHVSDIIGEFGFYQRHFIIFVTCLSTFGAINNMGYSFHAPKIDYWCADTPLEYRNITTGDDRCHQFLNPNESCREWVYDKSLFQVTIISEFDIVCDRSWYASLSMSLYQLGYVFSGTIFAYASDKFGRRRTIAVAYVIEIVCGFSLAFSSTMIQYVLSRWLLAVAIVGRALPQYTLMLELVGTKYRAEATTITGLGWIVGYVLLPYFAYQFGNFRYIQLTATVPTIFAAIYFFCFFMESPRWHIVMGQDDKAEKVLKRILKVNKKPEEGLKEKIEVLCERIRKEERESEKKGVTLLDLLRTGTMRKYLAVVCFGMAVHAFVYYGISLNIDDFGGNLFVNFALAGLVELPSIIMVVVAVRYVGRKKLMIANVAAAGLSCLAVIPLLGDASYGPLRVTLALIGKFFINSSYSVIYIHAGEMLPTVLRNTGLGAAVVFGRVGSISAPFVKELSQKTSMTLVMIIYSSFAIVLSLLYFILPETKGKEMPDTLMQAENMDFELEVVDKKRPTIN